MTQQSRRGDTEKIARNREWRILVVEDELLVAENIKEILQAGGYTVVGILSSGEEVTAQFDQLNPDLILMDISLGGDMDGIQTAVAIHNKNKDVPILFLTAYAATQFPHISTIPKSLFQYLTKPYHATQITESVEQLLNPSK